MSDEAPQLDRRKFLTVLGATGGGALALSGCGKKAEKLIPYLVQSEDQVPGVPTYYASTCGECASACGLHVKTREGRAIKVEGNPDHPVNRGKLCARGHATLQGLYNPGRVRGPMLRSGDSWKPITWDEAISRLVAEVKRAGGRIAALSGAGRGTFSDLLADWVTAAGGRVTRYEPFDHEPLRAANQQMFGTAQLPAHDFAKARFIMSFGADFLDTWLSPMENQRGFAASHGFANGSMARHVYVGPRLGLTALNADEAHLITPGSEAALALAMANVIAGGSGAAGALAGWTPEAAARETGLPAATIERLAHEFAAARPSLAVGGGIGSQHRNAAEVCAAVNLLNQVAGNIGQTVHFGADLPAADGYQGVAALMAAIDAGQVGLLLVHEANPVYTLPKATGFASLVSRKVSFKVSTSLFHDETTALCDMLLPNLHPLERWDDARPSAGVYGLMQPVMEPVFETMGERGKVAQSGMPGTWSVAGVENVGVSTGDVLLRAAQKLGGPFARFTAPTFEAHLKTAWQGMAAGADADTFWRTALARGGIYGERPETAVTAPAGAASLTYTRPTLDGDGEFVFAPYPHPFFYDGRGANRPWLLENPDPVTKVTWQSWVELSPATARRLDLRRGEMVRLVSPHGAIEAPVWIHEGVHDQVLAMPTGLGHTDYGQYATGRGVNPLDLLGAPGTAAFVPYLSTRVRLEKLNTWIAVATTEGNPRQLGRGIAEAMSFAAATKGLTVRESYLEAAGKKSEGEEHPETEVAALRGWRGEQIEMRKLGDYAVAQPSWGMTIDLAKCTGCSACVTACYSENNIPTVGYDEVLRGREMSWMRIERYWEGGADTGQPLQARFIPMLCQHCENAPCEPVCPVYAAYHTADGLNGQVYNRCVGTRYCSNNCPYKVRYFNWYKYNETAFPEPLNLQLNPDVTVRARGVMEKCTMCVQRIRRAQHEARLEDRAIRDGDFTTACAQSCPSDAIVFGDLRDPASRVARSRQDPRQYHVLEELNTRPAITYLADVVHGAEA